MASIMMKAKVICLNKEQVPEILYLKNHNNVQAKEEDKQDSNNTILFFSYI